VGNVKEKDSKLLTTMKVGCEWAGGFEGGTPFKKEETERMYPELNNERRGTGMMFPRVSL